MFELKSSVTVCASHFTSNRAGYMGGAVWVWGNSSVTVQRSHFTSNSAESSGGVFVAWKGSSNVTVNG